jgi:hypothetical protein
MISVRNGVINQPDMANRTRLPNSAMLGATPSMPSIPGGTATRDMLAQIMGPAGLSHRSAGSIVGNRSNRP